MYVQLTKTTCDAVCGFLAHFCAVLRIFGAPSRPPSANKRVYGFYPHFQRVNFQPRVKNNMRKGGGTEGSN